MNHKLGGLKKRFASRRKGQNMTLEEVMLIAVGVIVLIGTYSSFVFMKTQVSCKIQDRYGEEVINYMISNTYKLVDLDLSRGSVMVEIPDYIGEEYYIVSKGINKNEIMLEYEGGRIISKNIGLDVYGRSISTDKWIMISYNGSAIHLKGVNE